MYVECDTDRLYYQATTNYSPTVLIEQTSNNCQKLIVLFIELVSY